jgi:hypothetical protein
VKSCKTLGVIQEVQFSGDKERHLEHKEEHGEHIPGVRYSSYESGHSFR